jgi:non-ribosomal peptide synthetase component F
MSPIEKREIIENIDDVIYVLDTVNNVAMANILRRIQKKLKDQWSQEDYFYAKIIEAIR